MIKKARLSALVGLLALLFFPSFSYSLGVRGSDGSCYLIVDTSDYVIAPNSRYGVYSTVAETRLADNPMIKASGQYGGSTWGNYTRIGLISAYKWSGSGWSFAFYPGDLNGKYITDSVAAIVKSWSISAGAYPSLASLPASPPADACAVPACDIGDSDSDGICNSCDKVPGAPDPKDCVYMTSVNSQGQVVDMTINEGCKDKSDPSFNSENLAHYRNEEAASVGDGRLYLGR